MNKPWRGHRFHFLWPMACIGAFPFWVTMGFPWLDYLELNSDEGINLAKAALVAAGHPLYAQIWSDQPPVLTYLLAALQWVRPWDVTAARYVILASACLLLGALFSLVQQRSGRWAALWATLLLATSPLFVRLSVSVMVGLPAIALALLAWSLAAQQRLPRLATAALAGFLLALSLQTKLFTLTLAPAIAASLWLGCASPTRGRAMAIFASICVLTLLSGASLTGAMEWEQLVQPHFSPELRSQYALAQSAESIWLVLKEQPLLLAFGALGALLAFGRAAASERPALLGLLVPAGALLLHVPVWYHQVLLLLPALAWLGGAALARGGRAIRTRRRLPGVAVASTLLLAGTSVSWALVHAAPEPDRALKQTTSEVLQRYAGLGGWVVTDVPLDAFRAGLLVPPELAVYSAKRIRVGRLPPEDVLAAIQHRHPRQVLFRRFAPDPSWIAYLDSHYLPALRGDQFSHYVSQEEPARHKDPATVRAALDPMLEAFASTAVRGGYAGIISVDRLHRFAETPGKALGGEGVYMRPPGSTARVGSCFLRSYQNTGIPRYRQWARETAQALVRTQHCSGAWEWEATDRHACTSRDFTHASNITLDEGLVAEGIGFLLDTDDQTGHDASLMVAARHALDFLVAAQNAHGAWPYDFTTKSYAPHSTINDDLTTSHLRALHRGYGIWADPAYRLAVQKGIGFLLQTQLPQGGWAQQYDEALQPVGARPFEPAALASTETAKVVRTLMELDQHRADPRITTSIRRAVAWLGAAQISQGRWARFYDLGSGRPVYADRKGHRVTSLEELPPEQRLGYRWEGAFADVAQTLAQAQAYLSADPTQIANVGWRVRALSRLGEMSKAHGLLETLSVPGAHALADTNGLIWTKTFVDQCRQLNSLLEGPIIATPEPSAPPPSGQGS